MGDGQKIEASMQMIYLTLMQTLSVRNALFILASTYFVMMEPKYTVHWMDEFIQKRIISKNWIMALY